MCFLRMAYFLNCLTGVAHFSDLSSIVISALISGPVCRLIGIILQYYGRLAGGIYFWCLVVKIGTLLFWSVH